jgi:tRNA pseudouridine synthase 10
MVWVGHFPLVVSLPEVPFSTLESVLQNREWETYSIGVRCKNPLHKENTSKAVRARIANNPLFRIKKTVFEFPDAEIILDEVTKQVMIQILPVIITGKYTKLARTIAQTRHFCYECKGSGQKTGSICPVCNGEKVLTKESVQELIALFFKKAFVCDEVLFHGAGREDVDVRMLGRGRPFALTLENPLQRTTDVEKLTNEINASLENKVQLSNLKIGMHNDVAYTTQKYHTKRYLALVESPEKINVELLEKYLNQKMDVLQTTPIRVEKRRVMKERPHWIILEKIKKIDENRVEIELHASAGCYIKEFISGDEGRSKPSLSEWVGIACHCLTLDVLEIVEDEPGFSFSVKD